MLNLILFYNPFLAFQSCRTPSNCNYTFLYLSIWIVHVIHRQRTLRMEAQQPALHLRQRRILNTHPAGNAHQLTQKKREKDTPPPWLQPAGHSRGGAFFVLIQLPKKPPHRSLLQTDGEAHIHSDHSLSQSMPTYRRARAGPLPPPP